MAEISQYMLMYYDTCLKEEAERRLAIAERKFSQATEEERSEQGLKKPRGCSGRLNRRRPRKKCELASTLHIPRS
jgi:hypothetical protein